MPRSAYSPLLSLLLLIGCALASPAAADSAFLVFRAQTPEAVQSANFYFASKLEQPDRTIWKPIRVRHKNAGGKLSGLFGKDKRVFHVLEVEPGTYVYEGSVLAAKTAHFATCPGKTALTFEVAPGQAVYLGDLDFTHLPAGYREAIPGVTEFYEDVKVEHGGGYGKTIFTQDLGAARKAVVKQGSSAATVVIAEFSETPFSPRSESVWPEEDVLKRCHADRLGAAH